jgi:hypothetical protein
MVGNKEMSVNIYATLGVRIFCTRTDNVYTKLHGTAVDLTRMGSNR